ncbi:MAG: hypothetical protein CMF22_10260 [Idiomarinaceae bacterium]|nr:hypothetical protein [Idiomarinaceae bacterium]MBG23825.1 hypothetical protein [Idiomarinaceae bacterium]|tara:strand:- start:34096 stop:34368 length:273 start_codon:yes stop_codon:yes gene_type:complete
MIKTYYFLDDTWSFSNGCSCCEPLEMPCYNIDTDEHPDFSLWYGSAASFEECCEQVLMHEGILSEDSTIDFSSKALKELLVKNDLRVVII